MNALEVLERGGVEVLLKGGDVKVRGPHSVLTPEVLEGVRASKDELVELLFEREERAALQGCPDNLDASTWVRVMSHPAVLKLQSVGLLHSILEVRPLKEGVRSAA